MVAVTFTHKAVSKLEILNILLLAFWRTQKIYYDKAKLTTFNKRI